METQVKKIKAGWEATTLIPLPLPATEDGEPSLRISTHKDGRGLINSYAGVVWRSPGWTRHRVFKDFHKTVLSLRGTATEKAIRAQHDEALTLKDALIAEAVAHQKEIG